MNIIDIERSEDRELIIKTSTLKNKIEYAKEGFFLDILYQDINPEVKIEVAKKSAYLEYLRYDSDYLVKLEVLKKKGLVFMEFQDLNNEHLSIVKEAVKQGFPVQKLDYKNNMQFKLLILKEKGLQYCSNNNIIESYLEQPHAIKKEMILQGHKLTKNQIQGELGAIYINSLHQIEKEEIICNIKEEYLLKEVILSGYYIQNFHSNSWRCLFKDREFRFQCIAKGFYLNHILSTYSKDYLTIIEFIKNGYIKNSYKINREYYSVINSIKNLNNIEVFNALNKYSPLEYNELKTDIKNLNELEKKGKINNNKNNNVISI